MAKHPDRGKKPGSSPNRKPTGEPPVRRGSGEGAGSAFVRMVELERTRQRNRPPGEDTLPPVD